MSFKLMTYLSIYYDVEDKAEKASYDATNRSQLVRSE